MKKITDWQRPIFYTYVLCGLISWVSILSIFSCLVLKKMTWAQTGIDKIFCFAIFFILFVALLAKFPFLRPEYHWRRMNKKLLICRVLQFLLGSVVIVAFGWFIVQVLLTEINRMFFNELITVIGLGAAIVIIEKFIVHPFSISNSRG
ncbi:MAG TPA: hypothetical protein VMC41_02790 [Candidatus Nanoarchaeia archaeon]|nr:hypothetical protein [Candidatus Nanoarchaeia archaeon]